MVNNIVITANVRFNHSLVTHSSEQSIYSLYVSKGEKCKLRRKTFSQRNWGLICSKHQ